MVVFERVGSYWRLGGTLPPIILLVLLLTVGWLFADFLVLIPLQFIKNFSIPSWTGLLAIALLLSWCFGE